MRKQVIQQSKSPDKDAFINYLQEMSAKNLVEVFYKKGLFKKELQPFKRTALPNELSWGERGIVDIYQQHEQVITNNTAWEALHQTYLDAKLDVMQDGRTRELICDLLVSVIDDYLDPEYIKSQIKAYKVPADIADRMIKILKCHENSKEICQKRAVEYKASLEESSEFAAIRLAEKLQERTEYFSLVQCAKENTLTTAMLSRSYYPFEFFEMPFRQKAIIYYAAINGNNEIVKWFLSRVVEPAITQGQPIRCEVGDFIAGKKQQIQCSYLSFFAFINNIDLVEFYLNKYPRELFGLQRANDLMVLSYAALNGSLDVLQFLAQNNCMKPHQPTESEKNLLSSDPAYAAYWGQQFIAMQILQNHGIGYRNALERTYYEGFSSTRSEVLLWGGYKDAACVVEKIIQRQDEAAQAKEREHALAIYTVSTTLGYSVQTQGIVSALIKNYNDSCRYSYDNQVYTIDVEAQRIEKEPLKFIQPKCENATILQLRRVLFLVDEGFKSHVLYPSLIEYVSLLLIEAYLVEKNCDAARELFLKRDIQNQEYLLKIVDAILGDSARPPIYFRQNILRLLMNCEVEQEQLKSILTRLYLHSRYTIATKLEDKTFISLVWLRKLIEVKIQQLNKSETVESLVKRAYLLQAYNTDVTKALQVEDIQTHYQAAGQFILLEHLLERVERSPWDYFNAPSSSSGSQPSTVSFPMVEAKPYNSQQLLDDLQRMRQVEEDKSKGRPYLQRMRQGDENKNKGRPFSKKKVIDDARRLGSQFVDHYIKLESAFNLFKAFYKYGSFKTTEVQAYTPLANPFELSDEERGIIALYKKYKAAIDTNAAVIILIKTFVKLPIAEAQSCGAQIFQLLQSMINNEPVSKETFNLNIKNSNLKERVDELIEQYQTDSVTIQFRCHEYMSYLQIREISQLSEKEQILKNCLSPSLFEVVEQKEVIEEPSAFMKMHQELIKKMQKYEIFQPKRTIELIKRLYQDLSGSCTLKALNETIPVNFKSKSDLGKSIVALKTLDEASLQEQFAEYQSFLAGVRATMSGGKAELTVEQRAACTVLGEDVVNVSTEVKVPNVFESQLNYEL